MFTENNILKYLRGGTTVKDICGLFPSYLAIAIELLTHFTQKLSVKVNLNKKYHQIYEVTKYGQ